MNNRMLLIDDDEEMTKELKEILVDEGYDVDIALDGRKGVELVNKEKYAIVILDLKLPELNGYEVLRIIKKNPPGPKIIILSGHPSGKDSLLRNENENIERNAEILALADIVISKPVFVPMLIDKIEQLISRTP